MEIIAHANVLPWQVDMAFLMRLMEQALLAVALLATIGLVYAQLHRLLSNRAHASSAAFMDRTSRQPGAELSVADAWRLPLDSGAAEGLTDEA